MRGHRESAALCQFRTSARPLQANNFGPASVALLAVPANVFDPASTFLVVGERESVETLTDRLYSGEAQNTALEAAHPKGPEVPTIKHHRHAHRDNDSSRTTREQTLREPFFTVLHGKTRSKNMFEKTLQECRHGPVPERKQKYPVLGPPHVIASLN